MPEKKHLPPSRTKYLQTHPLISIRVSQDIHRRLQQLRQNGQSYGDTLRIGLGIQETNLQPLIERIEALELVNLQLEQEAARNRVTYPCSVCGLEVTVQSNGEKECCRQALVRAGWGHASCHQGQRAKPSP